MTDENDLALIHAEIDGELDTRQRGELARRLLADPEVRAVRDELRRLCASLEQLPEVEPPAQLKVNIARALPPAAIPVRRAPITQPRWRIAAAVAGALALGSLLFVSLDGQKTGGAELAGTMAAPLAPLTLDTARLQGPVTGEVRLYRDAAGLGVAFDVASSVPVDAVITGGNHTLKVAGVGHKGTPTAVSLVGFGIEAPQGLDISFLAAGAEVGHARVTVPAGY
jgi:anti-sigma factor RsiW